ncbi:hypothetical protein EBU71_22115 [bacterium]|nr:hypothetical protein [Candidatus Elulimicrobium humile]
MLYGENNFYQYMTDQDKKVFFNSLKVFKIDTSSYQIVTSVKEYMKHVNTDSIGGVIVSSRYKRYDKKEEYTTCSKQKTGSPISKPVLFISYWKDPKEDNLTILFMTKS